MELKRTQSALNKLAQFAAKNSRTVEDDRERLRSPRARVEWNVNFDAIPLEWKIVASGDFNGDGHTDILWQDTSTGYCDIWFMNGTTHVGTSEFGPIPTQWQIAGTGDFNGDANPDILWQNICGGERSIWFMNGPNYAGGVSLPTIPTDRNIRNH